MHTAIRKVELETLDRETWQARRKAHQARVRPWVKDRVDRSQHGIKHPVYDFLFEYYPFRPAHLSRWSPGWGIICEGMNEQSCDWPEWFAPCDSGMALDAERFKSQRRHYLDWAIGFLQATSEREATFHCFGLHEWAMVYKSREVRHSQVPLRLSPGEVDRVVDSLPLRCTHFDAYRFFTPDAVPLNRMPLTRDSQVQNDQPGCIHANMDLYKFAFAVAPFFPAELTADCFTLAIEAREIDMRASPYDLRTLGYQPLCIETREGRDEYLQAQRDIAERAMPLRRTLLTLYRRLRERLHQTSPDHSHAIEAP